MNIINHSYFAIKETIIRLFYYKINNIFYVNKITNNLIVLDEFSINDKDIIYIYSKNLLAELAQKFNTLTFSYLIKWFESKKIGNIQQIENSNLMNLIFSCLNSENLNKIHSIIELKYFKYQFSFDIKADKQANFLQICANNLEFKHWEQQHINVIGYFFNIIIPHFFQNNYEQKINFLYYFFSKETINDKFLTLNKEYQNIECDKADEFKLNAFLTYEKSDTENYHSGSDYATLFNILNINELIEHKPEQFKNFILSLNSPKIIIQLLRVINELNKELFIINFVQEYNTHLLLEHPEVKKIISYIHMKTSLISKEDNSTKKIKI